jgi:hypothetical protein
MRVFIGAIMLFVGFTLKGQQSVIKLVSDVNLIFTDSSFSNGDTMKYSYEITNTGSRSMTVPYGYWSNGQYYIYGSFDNKVEVKNEFFPSNPASYSYLIDDHYSVDMKIRDRKTKQPVDYVMPQDTVEVYIEDVIQLSTRHKAGNNTIVVWPENMEGYTIPDSMTYNIKVVSQESGAALSSNSAWLNELKIYPNPVSDYLYIDHLEDMDEVSSVNIKDLNLRLLKTFNSNYRQLDVSELSAGLYTVNFVLNDGNVFTKPIVVK